MVDRSTYRIDRRIYTDLTETFVLVYLNIYRVHLNIYRVHRNISLTRITTAQKKSARAYSRASSYRGVLTDSEYAKCA
jgi:hypothetical protein